MSSKITPYYIDEGKFLLGGGLHGLAGYYHEFSSLVYIAGLLLEKLDSVRGLERKLAQQEVEQIHNVAIIARIGAWQAKGTVLLSAHEEIDPKQEKTYLTKLFEALQHSKKDFETLASKASEVWNSFYNQGDRDELEDLYLEANRVLDQVVLSRYLGRTDEYRQEIQQLDEICRKVTVTRCRKVTRKKMKKC